MTTETIDTVDVAFSLRGDTIPADHGWQLFALLSERIDWLMSEPAAGVHPIRGARAVAGQIHLGARARLMLRLPRPRVEQALALEGTHLRLGGGVEIGNARLRPLLPHATLYSQFVSTGTADEVRFHREIDAELQVAGVACKVVCGRARRARSQDADIVGFSVMLHELSPAHALGIMASGLGAGRKLGCGLFVPHKSAAAVGA
jgi:CRISPR-associated protein Cas6